MPDDLAATGVKRVLGAVGEVLRDRGERIEIVIIGGSALILAGLAAQTRTTRDVDVVALRSEGKLVSAEPLPTSLVEAARDVGRVYDLREDWLNAGPTSQLEDGLPPDFEHSLATFDYDGLVVLVPSRRSQVALKLFAAADSSPSNRHEEDLERMPELPNDELMAGAEWASQARNRNPRKRIAELVDRLMNRG